VTGLEGLRNIQVRLNRTRATASRVSQRGGNAPSMRMLMNRICIALSGFVSPNIVLKVINVSAAAAVLSWKERKF
jgi:hypothetical protein